jgi:hypothetical protein
MVIGLKINVLPGDTIILKPDKRLWVSGYNQNSDNGDTLVLSAGSVFIKETGAQLNTCYGGTILDYGAAMNWSPNSFSHIFENSELSYLGTSHIISNDGHVEVDGYARLKVGNNTTVTFDGAGTYLKLNPNSIVQLGQNAKIVFKNGAYLKADNANFSGLNGATWEGIVFENAGTANDIKNCTFHNAKTSLKFDNNSYGENSQAEIINNTFNIPQLTTAYGLYGNNMFKLNIKDNRFYNQSFNGSYTNVGVYLKSSFNPGPPPEEDATPYALTIQYNLFKGGKAGIILANYASQYIPYSIYYNNFNDSSSYFSDYGIIGRKIDGDIKHCVFYPGKFNHNINVTQSNIKVGNSHLNSNYYNFNLNNYSSLDIGGTESSGYNVYLGGFNYLSSLNNTNIYLSYYQSINLQNGRNCFLNYGGSGYYHLNGVINTEETTLNAVGNSWGNGIPVYSLVNRNNENMTVNYTPIYNCNSTTGLQIHQIVDKGNGLIDTIYKLPNSTTFLNPETNLYLQAQQYANNSNYPTSILNLKTLISQYPTGMYQPYILNDLYLNYEKLDTSSNQGYRDNLYSDLKNFLNEKINSGLYDFQFNDLAYQLVLMCEGNMQNYNDALTGYEFIAMYHPDAATRLLASWDYVEIDALLNGMGGGNSENISEVEFAKKEMKRLEKVIRKDSVLTSLKRNYDKLSKEQSKETKTDLKSKDIDVYEKASFKKEKDEKIIRKSMTVLMGSKSMSRELKAEKQLEDILLISSTNSNKKVFEGNSSLPGNYNLSQNYPNPFNPVTKINFALPKQGFVTLKIYDITGREIQILVSDVKQAGYYSVDFNGSSLSSGVYFYRIQSNDFVMTKRMVLIK